MLLDFCICSYLNSYCGQTPVPLCPFFIQHALNEQLLTAYTNKKTWCNNVSGQTGEEICFLVLYFIQSWMKEKTITRRLTSKHIMLNVICTGTAEWWWQGWCKAIFSLLQICTVQEAGTNKHSTLSVSGGWLYVLWLFTRSNSIARFYLLTIWRLTMMTMNKMHHKLNYAAQYAKIIPGVLFS